MPVVTDFTGREQYEPEYPTSAQYKYTSSLLQLEKCRAGNSIGLPAEATSITTSLALPTLYPKSRVVGSGLIRYMELTRNLFIQLECVFSS